MSPLIDVFLLLFVICPNSYNTIRVVSNWNTQNGTVKVLTGSNVTLQCLVMLEDNDQLYSIKWYRKHNGHYYEFYSFISSPHETIHHQPLPDMVVVPEQRGQSMSLVNVSLPSEGIFRCEVISDDVFQVNRQEFHLTVLVPPEETPTILSPRHTYGLGERVQLRCITGASRPAPTVHWYINNKPVPESYVVSTQFTNWTRKEPNIDSRHEVHQSINHHSGQHMNIISSDINQHATMQQTTSIIDFVLTRIHLIDGHFTIRCASSLQIEHYPEGLQFQYQIDDLIELNCTVPSFYRQVDRGHGVHLQWNINGHHANKEYVVDYFEYGLIGLRFYLQPCHFDTDTSLSIGCTSLQTWAQHELPPELAVGGTQDSFVESDNKTTTQLAYDIPTTVSTNTPTPTSKPLTISEFVDKMANSNDNVTTTTEIELLDKQNVDIGNVTSNERNTSVANVTTVNQPAKDVSNKTLIDDELHNTTSTLYETITRLVQSRPQLMKSLGVTLIPIIMLTVMAAVG